MPTVQELMEKRRKMKAGQGIEPKKPPEQPLAEPARGTKEETTTMAMDPDDVRRAAEGMMDVEDDAGSEIDSEEGPGAACDSILEDSGEEPELDLGAVDYDFDLDLDTDLDVDTDTDSEFGEDDAEHGAGELANEVKKQVKRALAPLMAQVQRLSAEVAELKTDLVGVVDDIQEVFNGSDDGSEKGLLKRVSYIEETNDELIDEIMGGEEGRGIIPRLELLDGEISELRARLFGENESAALEPFGNAPVITQLAEATKEALECLCSVDVMAGPNHERAASIASDNKDVTLKTVLMALSHAGDLPLRELKEKVAAFAMQRGVKTTEEAVKYLANPDAVRISLMELNGISPELLDSPKFASQKERLEKAAEIVVSRAEHLLEKTHGIKWDEIGGDA